MIATLFYLFKGCAAKSAKELSKRKLLAITAAM
jgi:hypothetical protein